MLWIITGIAISYLVGSVPTAYIFGRLLRGIDIRKFGSGNVGATNVARVLGKGPGIAVLILDMLKGFLAVFVVGDLVTAKFNAISEEAARLILGLSSISGHNWTIFLGFKGGKGIAAAFGVLLALAIKMPNLRAIFGLVVATWFAIFFITKIVSIASVLTGIMLPIYMLLFRQSTVLIFVTIILTIFIIFRHKSNLTRAFQGKEPRFSFKKP